MPRDITVTFDDGTNHVYQNAPDNVTPEQVSERAQNEFGKSIVSLDGGRKPQSTSSPLSDSDFKNFTAGMGHGFSGLITGAKELNNDIVAKLFKDNKNPEYKDVSSNAINNNDKLKKQVDEERILAKPLMDSKAGFIGDVSANVAASIPLAMGTGGTGIIPALAANTATGAGLGAMQARGDNDSLANNTLTGAAFGAGGTVAGRALQPIAKGASAYVAPLFQKGQDKIVANTLKRFGLTVDDLMKASGNSVEGYQPTLAEIAQKPGISGLQLAAKNSSPEAKQLLLDQEMKNNGALVNALRGIGKDDSALEAAQSARNEATKPLYEAANSKYANLDPDLEELLNRPSIASAWGRAEKNAYEKGIGSIDSDGTDILNPSRPPKYSGEKLHLLKMAMDDMLSDPTSGIAGNEANSVRATRNKLVDWIGKNIPEYDQARKLSSEMAKPVNQMQIGQYLASKLESPLLEGIDNPTALRGGSFASALSDPDQLAKKATGFGGASFDSTMEPDQVKTIYAVRDALANKKMADDMAKTVGSTTAQNLAADNILRQIGFGKLADGELLPALSRTAMAPHKFAGTEKRLTEKLAEALANPKKAQEIMQNLSNSDSSKIAALLRGGDASLRYGSTGAALTATPYASRH